MNRRTVVAGSLLVLCGVACGDGGGTDAAPGGATSTTALASGSTTTAADRYASSVRFSSSDGSQYLYTPAIGEIVGQFAKNIDTSPPGKARLAVTGGPGGVAGFPGTIVGTKPGGRAPDLAFTTAVRALWQVSEAEWTALVQAGSTSAQGCGAESQADPALAPALKDAKLPPFALACSFDPAPGAPWSFLGPETDESFVDVVVGRGLEATLRRPYLVLTAQGPAGDTSPKAFRIILAPDGSSKVTPR